MAGDAGMTDRPIIFSAPMVCALLDGRKTMTRRLAWRDAEPNAGIPVATIWQKVQPGDRLWVRENFCFLGTCDPGFLSFQATYPDDIPAGIENVPADIHDAGYRWTPCIHMPRRLSRLTLIVTGTKTERLQDISAADAEAEGIPTHVVEHTFRKCYRDAVERGAKRVEYFRALWIKLHAAESWDANPEVAAISFRVVKANIDHAEAA